MTNTPKDENKPKIELLRVTNVGEVKTIVYRGRETATIDVDIYTIDSDGNKKEGTYVIHTPGNVFAETFAIAKALHKKRLSDELVIFTLSSDVARLINDKSGYGKAFNDLFASFHRNDVKPKAYHENETKTKDMKTKKETI